MSVTIFDVILISIEVLLYTFHASVFVVLIKFHQSFKGAFYNLFRVIFIADFCWIIWLTLAFRLPGYGVSPEFFKAHSYLASLGYNLTTAFGYTQYLTHMMLAFNRLTLTWCPKLHPKIWSTHWYTAVVITLPLCVIVPRLVEPGTYIYLPNGQVLVLFMNFQKMADAYTFSAYFYGITTLVQTIFGTLAIYKYWEIRQRIRQNMRQFEGNLLTVVCLTSSFQALRTVYSFLRPLFANDVEITVVLQYVLPLIADLYAWCGGWALLAMNPGIRKEYIKLYVTICLNVYEMLTSRIH